MNTRTTRRSAETPRNKARVSRDIELCAKPPQRSALALPSGRAANQALGSRETPDDPLTVDARFAYGRKSVSSAPHTT